MCPAWSSVGWLSRVAPKRPRPNRRPRRPPLRVLPPRPRRRRRARCQGARRQRARRQRARRQRAHCQRANRGGCRRRREDGECRGQRRIGAEDLCLRSQRATHVPYAGVDEGEHGPLGRQRGCSRSGQAVRLRRGARAGRVRQLASDRGPVTSTAPRPHASRATTNTRSSTRPSCATGPSKASWSSDSPASWAKRAGLPAPSVDLVADSPSIVASIDCGRCSSTIPKG
jgi:hypothetical protein